MQGCADALDIPHTFLYTINWMYNFYAHCTSIVFRQVDNTVIHARNLDYSPTVLFRPMVVNLDFVQKGKIIYKSATIAGFFGNETGIRVNGFSVSID